MVPSLEYIAAFSEIGGSWHSRVQASARAARRVAQKWGPMPDLIEVTVDGLEWRPNCGPTISSRRLRSGGSASGFRVPRRARRLVGMKRQ